MTFFADLTPYTYTGEETERVVNVGWLSARNPFEQGDTSEEFRRALAALLVKPILVHRGKHYCEFCPAGKQPGGSGQIRVPDGSMCYAAPVLIHHYVMEHGYRPPAQFVEAVLRTAKT